MACYKARGFLQKAESLGLTARVAVKQLPCVRGSSKLAGFFLCRHTTFGGPDLT